MKIGDFVMVIVPGSVNSACRRVTGVRGDVVHLAQVIKSPNGETRYWCLRNEVMVFA